MTRHPGETIDSIVYPDLRVIQPLRGYRFSLDPILLASFPDRQPPGPVMDLGCGSGVLALLLARRWPGLTAFGIELQARLADRAGRSVRLNGLTDRVAIVTGDLRLADRFLRPECAGTIFANPPYRLPGTGRLSPDPEKAAARHELFLTLPQLVSAIDHLLSPAGEFMITWKPERLLELRRILGASAFALTVLRFVRSREGDAPFLVLCRGIRSPAGAPDPDRLPPLTMYRGRDYTPEAASFLTAAPVAGPLAFSGSKS